MTATEFQKPENAAALEKTLASCKLVMPGDSRAANCREARIAKFAMDKDEVGRIRREQILQAENGDNTGVSRVEMTSRKPADQRPLDAVGNRVASGE